MPLAPVQKLTTDTDLPVAAPERKIGDSYQVLRVLKTGADTETLLATDCTRGATVVIKTAARRAFSATARMRL